MQYPTETSILIRNPNNDEFYAYIYMNYID